MSALRRAALFAVTLSLTACSSGGTASMSPAVTASPSFSPSAAGSPGAPPSIAPAVCAAKAPAKAVCGTYQVPLDYADSSKGNITLPLVRVPATDTANRVGSLLVNPGGPGASGVEFVTGQIGLFTSLNRRFDIVGFDPRGTGGPDAIRCLDTAALDHLVGTDPIADDPAEKKDLVDSARGMATACAQKSGRLLSHVGTVNVARDMDRLRAALGEARISYLGFSYGTSIGVEYAAQFPTHIRAMVLDGNTDPSVGALDIAAQQAASLEHSFADFAASCVQHPPCALGADPKGAIRKIIAGLDAHPVTVNGRSLGRGDALIALVATMYDPTLWPTIATLFARAQQGNYAGLQLLEDAYDGRHADGFDPELESNTAINCADLATPTDVATFDRKVAEVAPGSPDFGAAAIYGAITCVYWPVRGPAAAVVDVRGAPPILLVGATNDPATPYTWSQSLHRQVQGSILLTRRGDGHPSYPNSSCVAGRVDAYLETLQAPADGTTCDS
jgi:pimeloyl-ACP methyl ester carboxylesterase